MLGGCSRTMRRLQILCGLALVLTAALLVVVGTAADGRRHLMAGISALGQGKPTEAIFELSACLAAKKDLAKAYQYRALAYGNNGDHVLAINDFTALIKLQPTNTDAYLGRGCEYMRMHDYAHARNDLTQVVKLQPDLAEAYRLRAIAEMKTKGFADSAKDCHTYLSRFNKQTDITEQTSTWMLLSAALTAQGKTAEAAEACSQAVALKNTDPTIYEKRAALEQQQQNCPAAIADYTTAIKLSPSANSYRLRAACYRSQGQPARAMEDLNHAIKLSPHDLQARRDRADVATIMHKYMVAISDLGVIVDSQPSNQQAREDLQKLSKLSGVAPRKVVSIAVAAETPTVSAAAAKKLAMGTAPELTVRGYQLLKSGRPAEAVIALNTAVRSQPQNDSARKYLAYALLSAGRPADAASQFQVLSRSHALLPDDLLQFGKALEGAGDIRGAISKYEDSVFLRPSDGHGRRALVEAYQRTGQTDKVIATARDGVRLSREAADRQQFMQTVMEASAHGH
jgi:tetratricopeptide (TPR) repeat protein